MIIWLLEILTALVYSAQIRLSIWVVLVEVQEYALEENIKGPGESNREEAIWDSSECDGGDRKVCGRWARWNSSKHCTMNWSEKVEPFALKPFAITIINDKKNYHR